MAIEKWISVASIGLFAMFAGEMISIYNFMTITPEDFEFGFLFDANPKILQFISIGVAPAGVLAGVSYLLSRGYGSKQIGFMTLGGGIILLIGMTVCYSLVDKIHESYISDTVTLVPLLFMALSIPVIIVGVVLLKVKKKRPKKEYF